MEEKCCCVVGEDMRQAAVCDLLKKAGWKIGEAAKADIVLLPAPLRPQEVGLRELLRAAKPGAVFFGGHVGTEAYALAGAAGHTLIDYMLREELAVRNAVATAEGTLALLFETRKETIWGACILVVGYGRCGRALAGRLSALGADVTVAARKSAARAWAQEGGCRAVSTENLLSVCKNFQVIINTVPELLLQRAVLETLSAKTLVVDLASAPGGVDHEAAKHLGIPEIFAPGLPAKYVPVSSGQFIAQTVLAIVEERGIFL